MNKNYIDKIQSRVIKLFKGYNKPLSVLTSDSCSEMARLVGSWIKNDYNLADFYILKGHNVHDNKSHDILAVSYKNKFYLIDPTVWQIFPNENNIFIGESEDLNMAVSISVGIYGGYWVIGEKLSNFDKKQIEEWENIIKENLEFG